MAEFQEVMRQWGRLCSQHCAANADDCDGCLLGGTRADVCGSYARDNAETAEELESIVMSWAEEHPEPVYPTWGEWLTDVGAIPKVISWDEPLVEAVYDAIQKHIPVNIAQKLGIEPKEDKPKKRTKDMVCGNDYCELE